MSVKMMKRQDMDKRYQWKTSDLFATDEIWQNSYNSLLTSLPAIAAYKGRLSESSDALLACLKENDRIDQIADKLYVYAFLRFFEDTGNTVYKGMSDKAATLLSKVSAAASFIKPEILAMPDDKRQRFITEQPGLSVYVHLIDNMARQKQHVLPAEQEELLAKSSEISKAPQDVFSVFLQADTKFGHIQNEDGQQVPLTLGNYISFMENKDRRVRKDAFTALYGQLNAYKNTYAGLYSASVTSDNFYADVRRYDSALEMELSNENIPSSVYSSLIEAIHEALPQLHRYMALRKKRLGVDELHMYDLYAPIVSEADTSMPYEKAVETFLKSIEPLGKDYVAAASKAFTDGWIDVYENEGKRSGAFQWGAYGGHPFVCLNYVGKIDDMFTLAHEMGHAMHSYYTWATQPYVYGEYTIFLAEVASTVNEALLMEYMLKTTQDKTLKAYLINHFLEQYRGTLFRQVMFAEFEMLTHQMAAQGEPLTCDSLSKLYVDLNQTYYGEHCVIDQDIAMEWARIPHFYNAFYVYKYATGYSAAMAFSQKVLSGDPAALDHYLTFLKSGSSDYSIRILQKAGVDMSSPAPIRDALRKFTDLLGQMESL